MSPPFVLIAKPWWVDLLLLVPIGAAIRWRKHRLALVLPQLLYSSLFAAGFGFVEAAVVIYLRAAVGLLPGYHGTLGDIRSAARVFAPEMTDFPASLLTVELWREAATILMLLAVALLAARRFRERWAIFLWCFAIWDAAYYGGLWATIHWPESLTSFDVLFLIPVPWNAQVWFPLLVSLLTVTAVLACRAKNLLDDATE